MKNRKQASVLSILLVLVVVLVIAYFTMTTAAKNKQEQAGNEANIELYSLDTAKTAKIEVSNENGSFIFEKEGDSWKLTSEKDFSLDQSVVETMLSAIKTIQASRLVVEDAEELGEYGLSKPKISIKIELEDGVSAKIDLGDEVPVQGGYYGLVDEENKVYVMDENYYTSFSYQKSELALNEDSSGTGEAE